MEIKSPLICQSPESYLEHFLVRCDGRTLHPHLLVEASHSHVDLWGAVALRDGLQHSEGLAVLTHCHVTLRHGILYICVSRESVSVS